jgi:hypothetical protein
METLSQPVIEGDQSADLLPIHPILLASGVPLSKFAPVKITVFGSGSFGTALATVLARQGGFAHSFDEIGSEDPKAWLRRTLYSNNLCRHRSMSLPPSLLVAMIAFTQVTKYGFLREKWTL